MLDSDQQQQCPATDPDVSINGCTAMIQSGHETQQKLAIDFYNRALAYLLKDQYDRAIEDFDQAIRINPNDATAAWAYGERSTVKSGKGDFAGAAADLAKARQLLNLLNPSVGK